MGRRYLITGGAGFIGSNFIRHLARREPDASVINLDALTHAGVRETVEELDVSTNHTFVRGDVRDMELVDALVAEVDVIVHFAAESHVDRSIAGPASFVETNVVGTGNLLEAGRRHGVSRFVLVSTDEVYGPVPEGEVDEEAPLKPSSPYSASKAGADLLAEAYARTYGYRPIITRCANNYGPYQFPEKVIPLFVTNLIQERPVPLYGDGSHEREWLAVDDHCAAVHLLVDAGKPGEIYNVGSGIRVSNLELARRILERFERDDSWIEHVPDRPGHDRRYAVDSTKIRALGWAPTTDLDAGLDRTVAWYRQRQDWWWPLRETVS